MTASLHSFLNRLVENLCGYFNTELGEFYISSAHRWLVYAVAFIMTGLCTFISLGIYEQSDSLITVNLTFKGMYAWHTAINFAICLALVDHFAAWLAGPWGAFGRRTVGKAWIILVVTFLAGFIIQRLLVYELVALYAPALLWTYEMDPSMRPGVLAMFLFVLPFWGVLGYGLVAIMLSKQAQAQELFRVRIDTILEERQRKVSASSRNVGTRDDPITPNGHGFIPLPASAGIAPIQISQIGHVTVEDHYLRIFYQKEGDVQNALIRMSLKDFSAVLPTSQFIQIHRSHIINLEQIAGIKRAGRNVRVRTKHGDFELPVSRYRYPQVLPEMEKYLHPS